MPSKALFVGMDAVDADLFQHFIAEGKMPDLASLTREGTSYRLDNCLETPPGAIWPEISTGISAARSGEFYHPGQIFAGEARIRPLNEHDIDPHSFFWSAASRAGKKVALVDVPQTVHGPDLNGLAVYEWGLVMTAAAAYGSIWLVAKVKASFSRVPTMTPSAASL